MTRRVGIMSALSFVLAEVAPSMERSKMQDSDIQNLDVIYLNIPEQARSAVRVRICGQEAMITPQELMDALLGVVKPNHCPVCDLDCGPATGCSNPKIVVPVSFCRATEAEVSQDKGLIKPEMVLSCCPRCSAAFFRVHKDAS